MNSTLEPLTLRLPKDILVLQPMHGHLELEPVLLRPGLRCVIGSAEDCVVRLTKSPLVQPEHIVINVVGRQTILSEWASESTWLNDRIITEPHVLVQGDRVAIGPFDFQVRSATADEMLYAKLAVRDNDEGTNASDVLLLKRAIGGATRDTTNSSSTQNTPTSADVPLDLFSELARSAIPESDSASHDRLSQHISRLLGDLQEEVVSLQEKDADQSALLQQQRESIRTQTVNETLGEQPPESSRRSTIERAIETSQRRSTVAPVRPEVDQLIQQLRVDRSQLERDRSQFVIEQAEWQDSLEQDALLRELLEKQAQELKSQQQALLIEQDACRKLSEELEIRATELASREARLRTQDLQRFGERRMGSRIQPVSESAPVLTQPQVTAADKPNESRLPTQANRLAIPATVVEAEAAHTIVEPAAQRPLQTLLTLIAFGLAAIFLGASIGDEDSSAVIGWGTAILGAISAVDLLAHRWLKSQH